jgi:hypothetical protein
VSESTEAEVMALLGADQSTDRELRDTAAAITDPDPESGMPYIAEGEEAATVGFSEMKSIISHFLQGHGYQSDDVDPRDICYRYMELVDPGRRQRLEDSKTHRFFDLAQFNAGTGEIIIESSARGEGRGFGATWIELDYFRERYPQLSLNEAIGFLADLSHSLNERMTDAGWNFLEEVIENEISEGRFPEAPEMAVAL